MTDNELKEIREKISCPQLGDEHYGEWGALNFKQRRAIKRMLDYIDGQEKEIERLTIGLRKTEHQLDDLCKMHNVIKAEAYKECIEKVKALFPSDNEPYQYWEIHEGADNLLKEMVGENK